MSIGTTPRRHDGTTPRRHVGTLYGRALALLLVQLAVVPSRRLAAQCPDGSAPPCAPARTPAPRIAIDPNAIAILPFRVSGPPEAQYLREGMVDLLNVGLDGFAGWRVLQPRAFLRQVGSGDRAVAEAARLAREAGAATFVIGSVSALGPELVAQAGLYESARASPLASVRARGTVALPAAVADSIAAGLARYRASLQPGVARRSTAEYTTASPAALQAYLVAEQLSRQARWPEAVDSLTAALARDSTFALAYYALYRALSWGTAAPLVRVQWGDAPTALTIDRVYDAATRHRERAPVRQRRLLEAIATYNKADALRLGEELTRSYPDDADVALEIGDAYFHLSVPMGEPPQRAIERLERAIALDPGVPEAYLHVVQLQCMTGDTAAAWRTLGRLKTVAPTWVATVALELGLRALLRGDDPATLPAAGPDTIRRAARYLLWSADSRPAQAVSLADSFLARLTAPALPRAERVPALLHRHLHRLAQGRYVAGWEMLRAAASLEPEDPEVLGATVLHHLVTGAHAADAAEAARQLAQRGGARPLWASALLGWRVATVAPVDSAQAALPEIVAGADWPAFRAALAAGLTGLLDLRRGDSVAARRALIRGNSEWIETRGVEQFFPNPYFALVTARLEVAAGEPAVAGPRLSETMATLGMAFRADAEELRGRIAEQRGDTTAAIGAYRNLVELWRDADPELQPRVAAARAALGRMERP
jgi:tetratricopeptide (TPR) repeat protein